MKKSSWPVFIPLAVFACLIAALVIALAQDGGGSNKFDLHIDEAAPVTQLPVVGATDVRFDTADWRGRAYIVNFFASWCVPCHAEHEALLDLAKRHIPIVGVAFKDNPRAVTAFLGKQGNPFAAIADDSNGRTGVDWGITGVPETFLIDAAGVIRLHLAGPLTSDVIVEKLLPAWDSVKK
jgi:DsbE subfamily thiol:disulfide oxidoreductase